MESVTSRRRGRDEDSPAAAADKGVEGRVAEDETAGGVGAGVCPTLDVGANLPHPLPEACDSKRGKMEPTTALISLPLPSSATLAAGDLDPCIRAVAIGTKRRDVTFLRQVFDQYKDGTECLPACNILPALSAAAAPVMPSADASSTPTITGLDLKLYHNSNGKMEFSEFKRAVAIPDELSLYFQERRQPALADALRALVGCGGDQLLRVSQLSSTDVQAACSAVSACLPEQALALHEELQRAFAVQFEMQAQMEADPGKFNAVIKMACGDIDDFHTGLTGRIGMPHLKFKDAMRQEHCKKAGCNTLFTTGNYKITTTPHQEWLYIAGDETGQQVACPDLDNDRRILPISELMKLQLAKDAKLTEVEMLAIVLYTGPMFQVYNCILRRFPAAQYDLFEQGGNLYATTIFVLVSAVQKVSNCTRIPEGTLLYRGLGGLIDLPDKFHSADEQGRSGYLDWGIMSTTSDCDVALGYSGVKQRRPRAMVMVIEATAVDRGADISEFSQYPCEKEFLWVPCSFVQRVQFGRGRVEVVDGSLVTFVPVRVNSNLKTETIDQLLQRKKSMHISGFEFRVTELQQRLYDDAKAGNAEARLKKDKDKDGTYWRKTYTVDSYIRFLVGKVQIVLDSHRIPTADDYSDDAMYRRLVAESLDSVSMARSALLWWLQDDTVKIHLIHDNFSLLWFRREYESYLRSRYKNAADEARSAAALELCKARNLFCVDIDEQNSSDETPLLSSVGSGASLDDVMLLICAKSDLTACNSFGESAVLLAAQAGRADIIDALVQAGADCNQADKEGRTPLYVVARNNHPSCIDTLIQARADVNRARLNGTTPLFSACCNGRTACVRELLRANADVSLEWEGWTPLRTAIKHGHHDVVCLLQDALQSTQ